MYGSRVFGGPPLARDLCDGCVALGPLYGLFVWGSCILYCGGWRIGVLGHFGGVCVRVNGVYGLSYSFYPGAREPPQRVDAGRFGAMVDGVSPFASCVCFRLLNRPLVRPDLGRFLYVYRRCGLGIVVAAGTALVGRGDSVLVGSGSRCGAILSLRSFRTGRGISFLGCVGGYLSCAGGTRGSGAIILEL